MSGSLVDTMMQQMDQQNAPSELNYQPEMMYQQQSPIQPQSQVRMGEVNYLPPEYMQAPTMQQGVGMQAMMGQPMEAASPETPEMEAPDLSKYGMEEEEAGSWMDQLMTEARAPLIVIALAFLMSLPQVNALVRNGLARITTNTLYLNVIMAFLIGGAFYLANKFLG